MYCKANLVEAKSFVLVIKNIKNELILNKCECPPSFKLHYFDWSNSNIELVILTKSHQKISHPKKTGMTLLLGDSQELIQFPEATNLAHAVTLEINVEEGSCQVFTSIAGLPPVFIYQSEDMTLLTSDLYLLAQISHINLEIDNESVLDLCRVGHLTALRTLFKRTVMAPCGHTLYLKQGSAMVATKTWPNNIKSENSSWLDFCENQIAVFTQIVKDMDTSNNFLSLTAGLDTRAILSALMREKKSVDASYTITGENSSLDARTAKALCQNYGIRHNNVVLDELFLKDLDKYLVQASRLSGGVCSLSQAHEIYFYEQVEMGFSCRISGNMGNQVGRGGTEGISMRNGNVEVFAPDFLSSVDGCHNSKHWFEPMQTADERAAFLSLLQNEIPNTLVGNYCIGNYFTVQRSPYAHKALIELALQKPSNSKKETLSLKKVRFNDLMHRFWGESESRSFQRKLLKENGGFVADYPINWGWRASGGVSINGITLGCFAMLDAIAEKKNKNQKTLNKIFSRAGISGLHIYTYPERWIKNHLKTFVFDTILSNRYSEIINWTAVDKILHEYFYEGKSSHHNTICFLLDFSLAKSIFVMK